LEWRGFFGTWWERFYVPRKTEDRDSGVEKGVLVGGRRFLISLEERGALGGVLHNTRPLGGVVVVGTLSIGELLRGEASGREGKR